MRKVRKRYKCMFLDQMPTGDILEVGCGSGKRLARMKTSGWKVTGQEIDPVAAKHVPDPVALLTTCHQFLKKNGLLVIATPNAISYDHCKFGAFWRGLEPPRLLHLFTCKTLTQMAQSTGFNHLNCWATALSAYGIGQGSQLSGRTAGGSRIYTSRDVLRGLWFQVMANQVFRKMKYSGEECVMMASK